MNKANIIKFLVESFCRHVYKEVSSEFLEKDIQINYSKQQVDIDCYDKFAFHMKCLKCTATKVQVHSRLVKKIDVTDAIHTWEAEGEQS